MGRYTGWQSKVEASLDGNTWVDITKENRTDFNETITRTERPRNDGDGLLAHDLTGHASGEVSFTLDSTSVSRPLFALGGGRRLWLRYSPEGDSSGSPWTVYQTLTSVSKTYEEQGAIVYTVTGMIEVAPLEGNYA